MASPYVSPIPVVITPGARRHEFRVPNPLRYGRLEPMLCNPAMCRECFREKRSA